MSPSSERGMMGLRCLLGHDFGEPEVEREREEEGNEMVATIREVKTCRRCGERQIVSENKEVTAIRSAEEVGLDEAEPEPEPTHPAVDEDDAADEEFDPPADADEDDGVILDEEAPERDPGEWPDRDGEAAFTADAGADDADPAGGLGADEMATEDEISRAGERPDADTVEDDAEFIDAEEAADDGGDVAWPEHEDPNVAATDADADADGPAPWPEHEGEDEGYDARPSSEADDEDHGVTFGSGFTPETANGDGDGAEMTRDAGGGGTTGVTAEAENESEARGEGFDAEFVGGPNTSTDTGEEFARAESEPVELETEMEGVPTEYFCPNCGYTREGTGSSMRAGDICPECRKGYMGEREA